MAVCKDSCVVALDDLLDELVHLAGVEEGFLADALVNDLVEDEPFVLLGVAGEDPM